MESNVSTLQEQYRECSYGKAVNTLTALVLTLQGKEPFAKRRPSRDYFQLRTWFAKQDRLKLNILYDYLVTLSSCTDSLGEMFEKAEKHRQEQQIKPMEVQPYKEINLEDVLNL